jgi:hypothetical protein
MVVVLRNIVCAAVANGTRGTGGHNDSSGAVAKAQATLEEVRLIDCVFATVCCALAALVRSA